MDDQRSTLSMLDRVASDCIAVRVRLINRVVSSIYDEALRSFGLRISQANILVAVARAGEIRPTDLARMLRIEKSTLSRDVELMKRHGWLESDPPLGGRNQTLRATPEGLNLLTRTLPAWEAAQGKASELLGAPGVQQLNLIADRLSFGQLPG